METKILATVGGQNITDMDVEQFLLSLGRQGEAYRTPEGRVKVLQELINRKLFYMDATRNLYEAEPAFKAQLKQAKESLLVSYAMEKTLAAITVKEEEIAKFYEEHKDEMNGGDSVCASHILVESEEEAARIRADIVAGNTTFEDAARRYSSCPSKEQGGDLGEFTRGQMVPEFENAAFAMAEGEISEPVKTQFGYHLIKLNAHKAGEVPALSEVREELRAHLTREKQNAAYQSKVNQLKILYPVDMF